MKGGVGRAPRTCRFRFFLVPSALPFPPFPQAATVAAKRSRRATTTNTVHFACFDCRKSFKQPGSSNWDVSIPKRPFPCPECQRPMVRLGRYFKAPRQRATRPWLKVELLYRCGECFESSQLGLDAKCRTRVATVEYLAGVGHAESDVRNLLEQIRAARRPRA